MSKKRNLQVPSSGARTMSVPDAGREYFGDVIAELRRRRLHSQPESHSPVRRADHNRETDGMQRAMRMRWRAPRVFLIADNNGE
jgi:hypothetical protein